MHSKRILIFLLFSLALNSSFVRICPYVSILLKFNSRGEGIKFLIKEGNRFIFNHTMIRPATIKVYYSPINSTFIQVFINITGTYVYDASTSEEYEGGIWKRRTRIEATGTPPIRRPYMWTLTFLVHTKSNYAWFNGMFIGFFPFYIFPTIGYENATKIIRHLYLNASLSLDTTSWGEIVIRKTQLELRNGSEIIIRTLWIRNDYCSVEFVYHYPIHVKCLLPLGNDTYAYFDIWIDDEYVPIVLEIDDYPLKETYTYVDVPRLIMVIVTLSCIAIGIVLLIRYIRRGCI